jgi:diguanylate cyclase
MKALPAVVTAYGPLHALAVRTHQLVLIGHCHEALRAADACTAYARAAGDHRTVQFLTQCRMYALSAMGRTAEAARLAEELLAVHRADGAYLHEAKTLCDLAYLQVVQSRYVDAMRNLARAGALLDVVPPDRDRHRSAMCSFALAATAAEMYETAAGAYERLCAADAPGGSTSFDLVYAGILLYWGLRLSHVGRADESAARLRRSAAITRRWLDDSRGGDTVLAAHALALAKLGDVVPAEKLARQAIVPLREEQSFHFARMAHLALGISLRAQGALQESRRELLAARELCAFAPGPDEPSVIRYELALTALLLDEGQSSRDLFEVVEAQARELWQLRLQRLAMLREARQREESESARALAEREVLRDPLTGLDNRRRFDLMVAAVDSGDLPPPVTLLLVDLDHFKAVNDAFSHSAGDRVLREVATILRAHCRAVDVPVRYAGDEFVVFLRADRSAGREVAQRIRSAVARAEMLAGVRVTVSVGVAQLADGMTGDALFRAADERLYAAKWSGRNAVAA